MPNYRFVNASDDTVITSGEFADAVAARSWAGDATELSRVSYVIEKQDVDGSWVFAEKSGRTRLA